MSVNQFPSTNFRHPIETLAAMAGVPGFWDTGPHDPLPIEATWDEFVPSVGGQKISAMLPKSPPFENADYLFPSDKVIAELKEVETEFSKSKAFSKGIAELHERVLAEDPTWRPLLFGGEGNYPQWFYPAYLRLFRPPIARVLKKANRQIRETKKHFGVQAPTGVVLFVNDGFTHMGPDLMQSLASQVLLHSYTSVDCLVYLTVNRYIAISGSDVPRLIWTTAYSERADDSLVEFIDDLGRKWSNFLEGKIGPPTVTKVESQERSILKGAKSILLPGAQGG